MPLNWPRWNRPFACKSCHAFPVVKMANGSWLADSCYRTEKHVGFNLWHLWSHNKLLLNARFFGGKEAPCEKTFAISSIQICVGCFQSHSKSVWTQLLRRHIVLSSWQKMEHQNQAVGSVAQCHNVWMGHVATALTEMLFVKHFVWFRSCLSGSPSFCLSH